MAVREKIVAAASRKFVILVGPGKHVGSLGERGKLPVNVKFIVEGEEEAGGEAIEKFVREDGGKKLAADCVVVSDSSMYAPGIPALTYGLRGLAYFEIRVQGPNRDLHSGSYGGGVMRGT